MYIFCCCICCVSGGISWKLNYITLYWYYYLFFLSLFESGWHLFRNEDCVWFLSDLFLDSCARHLNSMSSPFSIVSLVFIRLDKMLVFFGFISDDICNRCGKVGCHMNILLHVCAWLHAHAVNIFCSKVTRLFLCLCWNIFGCLASCWVLMNFLYAYLGGIFVSLVLASSDMVYWC